MKKSKVIFFIIEILLGISMFIYGGYDDSPGAQGLGLIAIILGIINIIKYKK
jgi:hypothetical protein